MRFLSRVLLISFVVQLVGPPVCVGDENARNSGNRGGNFSSGMSFRGGGAGESKKLGAKVVTDSSDYVTKGMMMTEPSMSGLTYQVHVLGEINNPGTYRITASDRLSEVLLRAGGVAEQGSQRNLEVRRRGETTRKIDLLAFQLNGDLSHNPYLLDNDVVYIPLKKGTIQVVGAVKRPENYEIKSEKTLMDATALAGGFSVGAAMGSPIRIVRFIEGKKDVIEVAANGTDMLAFQIQNGDVIFVPHMITEKNDFDFDIPKLPGDNIFYPSYEDRVFILGGVENPGAYPFNPYYNLSQYLSLAGGTTKMATGRINLVSADGKKKRLHKKDRDSIVINPGDTIVIDWRRIAPEGWLGIISSVTTLGLVALSLSDRSW